MSIPNSQKKFSYAEYLTWNEDIRFELIDGEPFSMTPAPSPEHQRILGRLFNQFSVLLDQRNCEVFISPFDVRLFAEDKEDEEVDNVVQPDLTVVCDKTKIDNKGFKGIPELVVEILSPSSIRHDRWVKFKLYERAGIREYWIVDIQNKSIEIFLMQNGMYQLSGYYSEDEIVKSGLFSYLQFELNQIFKNN